MCTRIFACLAGLGLAAAIHAQGVTQFVGYAGANPENFASTVVGGSTSITRTIQLSPTAPDAAGIGYAVSGPDFAVTGGTCTPTTVLNSTTPSCTVTLTFAPGSPGPKSGNLGFNCQFLALVGGITLNCTAPGAPAPGLTNIALAGAGIGSIATPAPTLGGVALSLLACLVLGFALLSMRRPAPN